MNRRVKIISDSTCDLTAEQILRHSIEIVPLYVLIEEKSFRDGLEVSSDDLFEYTERTKQLAKTSATAPIDFEAVFLKYIDEECDIFYTGISSKLSSTFQNAYLAKQMIEEELGEERIFLVDSLSLSSGTGLLVLEACEMEEKGLSAGEIAAAIEGLVPKVRAGFFVDTLRYLYYGGRCSGIAAMVGGALKLRPRLLLQNGLIVPGQKYHGSWDKCLQQYYRDVVGSGEQISTKRVFITHTASQDRALKVKELLERTLSIQEICITDAGAVIASHCGPGTLGILYIEK